MKQITNKEYQEFLEYKKLKTHGQILTPDALKTICQAYDYEAESIGTYLIGILRKNYIHSN